MSSKYNSSDYMRRLRPNRYANRQAVAAQAKSVSVNVPTPQPAVVNIPPVQPAIINVPKPVTVKVPAVTVAPVAAPAVAPAIAPRTSGCGCGQRKR